MSARRLAFLKSSISFRKSKTNFLIVVIYIEINDDMLLIHNLVTHLICGGTMTYHLTLLLCALFFPFTQVPHHLHLHFGIIVLITITLVRHTLLSRLLHVDGIFRHIDRIGAGNLFHSRGSAFLTNVELDLG